MKLHDHCAKMQRMASAYLEPGPYRGLSGEVASLAPARDKLFIADMIYLLDGPEQREAQSEEG